jgi:PTH1 family peptidyl-tRNA hydrolase
LDATWNHAREAHSQVAIGQDSELTLVLVKPQTYMNRSGAAVRLLLEQLEVQRAQCLVIYDDMDLPFGALRLRERGSAGTHNGMRSVVEALGSEDIPRLRIGISQAHTSTAIEHVLGGFSAAEQAQVDQVVRRAADAAQAWAKLGASAAMNRYNR